MTAILDKQETISRLTSKLLDAGVPQHDAEHYASDMVHDVLQGQHLRLTDLGELRHAPGEHVEVNDAVSQTPNVRMHASRGAERDPKQEVVFTVLDEATIRNLVDGWDRLIAESYLVQARLDIH